MGDSKKPRICEVLGVEVGEEWKIDHNGYDAVYRVSSSGNLRKQSGDGRWILARDCTAELVAAINDPRCIIHKSRWTQEDIEDAKAIRRIWPDVEHVEKSEERAGTGWMFSLFQRDKPWFCTRTDAFPSIKPGERVSIDEILEAEDGG